MLPPLPAKPISDLLSCDISQVPSDVLTFSNLLFCRLSIYVVALGGVAEVVSGYLVKGGVGGDFSAYTCSTISLPFVDVVGTSPCTYTCGVLASGPTLWRVMANLITELSTQNKQFFVDEISFQPK